MLVLVGPGGLGHPITTAFGPEPWTPASWTPLDPASGEIRGAVAQVALVDGLPPGGARLLWSRGVERIIWTLLPELPPEGRVELRFPAMEPAPEAAVVSLLGYRVQDLRAADLAELAAVPVPGLIALLRSIGLGGGVASSSRAPFPPEDRLPLAEALRGAFQVGASVGDHLPLPATVAGWPVLGLACALWTLPDASPDDFRALAASVLSAAPGGTFGEDIVLALERLRRVEPYAWALAATSLLPTAQRGDIDARFIAEASLGLPPLERMRLVRDLHSRVGTSGKRATAPGETSRVDTFFEILGTSLAEFPPAATPADISQVLTALAQFQAAGVLSGFFGPRGAPHRARVLAAVGEEAFVEAAQAMAAAGPPTELLDALGARDVAERSLTFQVLSGAGAGALKRVAERLSAAGQPIDGPTGTPAHLRLLRSSRRPSVASRGSCSRRWLCPTTTKPGADMRGGWTASARSRTRAV